MHANRARWQRLRGQQNELAAEIDGVAVQRDRAPLREGAARERRAAAEGDVVAGQNIAGECAAGAERRRAADGPENMAAESAAFEQHPNVGLDLQVSDDLDDPEIVGRCPRESQQSAAEWGA